MNGLNWGALIGGILGAAWMYGMPPAVLGLLGKVLKVDKAADLPQFLKRVRFTLFRKTRQTGLMLALWGPLLLIFTGMWLFNGFGAAQGSILGYLIALVGATFRRHLHIPLLLRDSVELTVRRLEQYAPARAIFEAGQDTFKEGDRISKRAILPVLVRLGSEEAKALLMAHKEDEELLVRSEINAALKEMEKIGEVQQPLSTKKMPVFLDEIVYLKGEAKKERGEKKAEHLEKKAELEEIADEIALSQVILRNVFPDLFCLKCYAWAKMVERERWKYVHCPRCLEVSHLESGIRQVVGKIGGNKRWEMKNGVLEVNLWDESSQQARFAEIDQLEIQAGADTNYDWAVSAVLSKLKDEDAEGCTAFQIRVSDEIVLEANTQNLLREAGWEG